MSSMVSLNPAISVGAQMAEVCRCQRAFPKPEIMRPCWPEMLEACRSAIPNTLQRGFLRTNFRGVPAQRIMLARWMLLRPNSDRDESDHALDNADPA